MFSGKALLIIGLALALWGRSLTHDDQLAVGFKTAGQVRVRSTSGAVSLSASEGVLKGGKEFAFETSFRKVDKGGGDHKGFNVVFQKPLSWEIRLPIILIAVLAGLWLFFRARMAKS